MIIQLICIAGLARLAKKQPLFSFIPPLEFQVETARKVLPVSFLYIGMIVCNNVCLYYVEVSFYPVARSLTIIFTLALIYFRHGNIPSRNGLIACSVVVVGYIISSVTEIYFSFGGIIFGLLSSLFVSIYSMGVKYVINDVNDNTWRLLSYNTIISVILMFPFVLVSGEIRTLLVDGKLFSFMVWFTNIVGGLLAFSINVAIFFLIKYTSPITNNVAGTVKTILLVLLSLIIFRNPVTFLNILGILFVITGSGAYSYFRHMETPNVKS